MDINQADIQEDALIEQPILDDLKTSNAIDELESVGEDEPNFSTIKASAIPIRLKLIIGCIAVAVGVAMYYSISQSFEPRELLEINEQPEFIDPEIPLYQPDTNLRIESTVDISNSVQNSEIDLFALGSPATPVQQDTLDNREDIETSDIVIRPQLDSHNNEITILKSKLAELEERDTQQAQVVSTSIEIQSLSQNRLEALVTRLDNLNAKLDKATKSAKSRTIQAKVKPTPINQNLSKKTYLDAKLIGMDMWGGDRFAQINFKGTITLLTINESMGEWTVINLKENSVTLRNLNGETHELTQ